MERGPAGQQSLSLALALTTFSSSRAEVSLKRILLLLLLFVLPAHATTYYLSPTGNDSNNGTSPSTPWLTPNHAVNCGDTITATASTAYSYLNFTQGEWGAVSCPAGNNVAWLKCTTFDACKIQTGTSDVNCMDFSASYWGVQGWECDQSGTATQLEFAICFAITPPTTGANIHHIVLANNIANGCGANGFSLFNHGAASVDYVAIVGNIAYNAAQGNGECYSGISIYQPLNSDILAGTHIFVAGNYSWGNVDPNPCAGGTPSDGEGITLDSINGGQGGLTPVYSGQIVVENNISVWNGGNGIAVSGSGNTLSPIYILYNTDFGNNTAHTAPTWCSDHYIDESSFVQDYLNIVRTNAATSCASGTATLYAYSVNRSTSTVTVHDNFIFSPFGNNTSINSSNGFTAYGPNNITGIDPAFINTAEPPAPSCGTSTSVPNCMASVIANFTPTAPSALLYGYQSPKAVSNFDPLFPQWLCNVGLPVGLVTMGCLPSLPTGNWVGPIQGIGAP
jgi:hypothetical protein